MCVLVCLHSFAAHTHTLKKEGLAKVLEGGWNFLPSRIQFWLAFLARSRIVYLVCLLGWKVWEEGAWLVLFHSWYLSDLLNASLATIGVRSRPRTERWDDGVRYLKLCYPGGQQMAFNYRGYGCFIVLSTCTTFSWSETRTKSAYQEGCEIEWSARVLQT